MKMKFSNYTNTIKYLLFALFAIVSCWSILFDGIHLSVSSDLTFHLNRIVGINDAFSDGFLIPRIYPYANNGFGYATPLFYCDLFLYPFALLYRLGLTVVTSYKCMILFYSFIAVVAFYKLSKEVTRDEKISILGSFLYVTASYRLYDVIARAAVGEIIALSLIPFVLKEIYLCLFERKDNYISLGISFALLVLSHLISSVLIALLFIILIIVFVFINKNDKECIKKQIITIIKATILGLLLACWFVLPMLEQFRSQEFYLNYLGETFDINNTTQGLMSVFYPFTRLDIQGRDIFSIISNGFIVLSSFVLYLFSNKNWFLNTLYITSFVLILMILGLSPVPGIIGFIQFLFRLNSIITPAMLLLVLFAMKSLKLKKVISIIFISYAFINACLINYEAVFVSENRIQTHQSIEEINSINLNGYILDYNHTELGGAEYLPYTIHTDYINDNKAIKYVDENGKQHDLINEYNRSYSEISFGANVQEETLVTLPLSYYKGYSAYVGDESGKIKIPAINMELYKKVAIRLQPGEHSYTIKYTGTKIQKISSIISFCTLIGVVLIKKHKDE